MEGDRLIDLWQDFCPNPSDADKNVMPMLPTVCIG